MKLTWDRFDSLGACDEGAVELLALWDEDQTLEGAILNGTTLVSGSCCPRNLLLHAARSGS